MLLFAGLGNPGTKYANNRHNIGFMAVDEIVRRHNFSAYKKRFQGDVSEGSIAGMKILALRPGTFMNRSGQSVGEAMRFYKIPIENVIVFHDEIDLVPGKIKVKTGGGAAGNNGVRSVASHIGAEFKRVRLGVGHPGDRDAVQSHVLSDFAKADQAWLEPLIEAVAAETEWLVRDDDARFLNAVALRLGAANEVKD